MSLIFDENGRPFIVLRDQDKKKRTKGLEAHKVNNFFVSKTYLGQHHCRKDSRKSFENLLGTKGNGQNAGQPRWRRRCLQRWSHHHAANGGKPLFLTILIG